MIKLSCEIPKFCVINKLKSKCHVKMCTVQDVFFMVCFFLSLRWEAIPLHSVRSLLHPEGKPASPHQTALRGEAFQMPDVQLRLPPTWRSERAPAHPFWYQPATHSLIHSHVKPILYAPVYGIMLVGFSLLHVGFSLLLNLNTWGLPSLHGFSSNTLLCTFILLHTSHMTSYSFTSGNLLIHFQFTCFTCRHNMHNISFVWKHLKK